MSNLRGSRRIPSYSPVAFAHDIGGGTMLRNVRYARRSQIILTLTTLLLFFPRTGAAQSLSDAEQLIDSGRTGEAATMLQRILDRDLDNPEALILLARVTFDGVKSQEYYRRALDAAPEGPTAPRALIGIASFYFANGFYSNAHRLARRVVDGFPNAPEVEEALLVVGRSMFASGQKSNAIETLQPLLSSSDATIRHAATIVWAEAALAIGRYQPVADVLGDAGWRSDPYAMILLAQASQRLRKTRDEQNARWRSTLARRAWYAETLSESTFSAPSSTPIASDEVSGATSAPDEPPTGSRPESTDSFSLQIGAFGSEENANRLANRVRQEGFTVNVRRTGSLYRVLVGQYVTRDEARDAISGVRSASGQEAVIVRNR